MTNKSEERSALSVWQETGLMRQSRESVSQVSNMADNTEGRSESVSVEWE